MGSVLDYRPHVKDLAGAVRSGEVPELEIVSRAPPPPSLADWLAEVASDWAPVALAAVGVLALWLAVLLLARAYRRDWMGDGPPEAVRIDRAWVRRRKSQ